MTPAQTATYHRQYLRWHTQQERIAVRIVLSRFRFMLNALTYSIKQSSPEATLALINIYVSDDAHQRLLADIYVRVGVPAAQRQYERLIPPKKTQGVTLLTKDRDVPPLAPQQPRPSGMIRIDHNSEQWRQRMVALARDSETASRVTKMAEKTRQLVRDVLVTAAETRQSLTSLVKSLRSVVVDKVRARLIARTETTRAANAGHEIGADSTLLLLNKLWIATADARTRQDHLAMLGSKPVPKDGVFIVGGLAMKYPGDPAGGAAQCCQCRCVCTYIPASNIFD